MGNRRLGVRRLESVLDNMLNHKVLNGLNGSPFSVRDPDRVYLEEFFLQRPALNAAQIIDPDADDAAALAAYVVSNKNFEILGTNATADDVTFAANNAGIQLQTDGGDNDSIIVLPHLDTNQTAWSGTKWGTENQIQWECVIRTDASIADMGFWAGMKLTNTPVYATDDDQAYFLYDASNDSGALTTNANLHFVYSVDDVDYITDLGITVAAATNYRLGISVDSARRPRVWVNGVQYGLVRTATAGGATQSTVQEGLALADDHDLIPYVGVIARTGAAKTLHLASQKMSRIIFE
tara:strand:+ start:391 stop:1272 length:882 start_codon:yes stop_codon:yes gene_type:complete